MSPVRPIFDVARDLDFAESDLLPWGPGACKITPATTFRDDPLRGKLILVSAVSPTPAGEGKTTTSIGLTQAARALGKRAMCALREPSLGPVFGQKGGGAGGGKSQLVPQERINLHFTGDLHAITAANNLLAALVDNDIYFRSERNLDARLGTFRRVLDMNDRNLRRIITGLGGKQGGQPREDSFDITAASEVMATLCLARDYADLKQRLGSILVGTSRNGSAVYARDLNAQGAMAALLRDAMLPNLVQTSDGSPALVHGGPFANIAHGCNSIAATRLALRRADYVFTEAGFGFDLGGEKFLDIKCRLTGLWPDALVLVTTLRALKYHGGVPVAELPRPDSEALRRGLANLDKHVENARFFGLDPVVAINVHAVDTPAELAELEALLTERGIPCGAANVYGEGGAGAIGVCEKVLDRAARPRSTPRYVYELSDPPVEKIRKIATTIYGAESIEVQPAAKASLERAVSLGFAEAPVCMAKTHLSLSDDDKRVGRPQGWEMTIRDVRVSGGAGFLVALTGELFTMPGLPRQPASHGIDLTDDGEIVGVK